MSAFAAGVHDVVTDDEPRCGWCGKLLARRVSRPWYIDCRHCKYPNVDSDSPKPLAPEPPKKSGTYANGRKIVDTEICVVHP